MLFAPFRGNPCALALATFLAAGVAAGCAKTEGGPRSEIHLRFIGEAPQELFDPEALVTRKRVFLWRLGDPEEAGRWIPEQVDHLEIIGGGEDPDAGLALRTSHHNLTLARPTFLDAEAVDLLELTVAGRPQGARFTLSWIGPGQSFSPERRVQGRLGRQQAASPTKVRFDVGDHPEWRGTIRRLRLSLGLPAGGRVLLSRLIGFDLVSSPESLAAALLRPWLVDLDGDVRSAQAVVPGKDLERVLRLPEGARLHFAYGAVGRVGTTISFRVEALEPGAPGKSVVSVRIEPEDEPGWREATVDLSPLAGRTVRLRLRVTAGEPLDPARGLPFWGHPEVLRPRREPARPNLALVSLDTLRADHLSIYGYPRETSPNLDAWARRRATVFLNTVAQAPWTLPSHVSMLTGLNAHRHGANHKQPVPADTELLAERFRRAGYTTLAVTGGGYLDPKYGFAQGFDHYLYWHQWHNPKLRDDEFVVNLARALDLIERYRDRPLFVFFHTYEIHAPFLAREPYFRTFSEVESPPRVKIVHERRSPDNGFVARKRHGSKALEEAGLQPEDLPELVAALYDSGIAYTDAQIVRFLEAMEEVAPPSGTVVALTSDHGEMLGEHGLAAHGYLHEETLMVPLLIQAPDGRGAGHRVEEQVRSVDIVPTLLELTGLPSAARIDGRSLVSSMTGRGGGPPKGTAGEAWSYATSTNEGISLRLNNRLKYVLNPTAWAPVSQREALYDLRNDPGEERNLAGIRDTEPFRRQATQALTNAAPGLRLRFANHGPTPFGGFLDGPLIHPLRLELIDPLCFSCITWESQGHAAFTVAPGQEYTLLIEQARSRELTLTVTSAGGEPVKETILLGEIHRPWVLRRVGDGTWQREDRADGARTGSITVWWQGEPPLTESFDPEADEALEAQLQALGYLQ